MKLPFKRSKISLCVGLVITSGYQANAAEDEIEEMHAELVADTEAEQEKLAQMPDQPPVDGAENGGEPPEGANGYPEAPPEQV